MGSSYELLVTATNKFEEEGTAKVTIKLPDAISAASASFTIEPTEGDAGFDEFTISYSGYKAGRDTLTYSLSSYQML